MAGWLGAAALATAQTLTIAAASDLQAVLPSHRQEFRATDRRPNAADLRVVGQLFFATAEWRAVRHLPVGGSGAIRSNWSRAARHWPTRCLEYASGRIVVWARKDAGLDVQRGLGLLSDSRVRRVAIANPEHAPYGRAAVAALRHENLYDAVQPKLVFGENISQAAQFVQSGNADAGILALSVALAPALKTGRGLPGDPVGIPPADSPGRSRAALFEPAKQPRAISSIS